MRALLWIAVEMTAVIATVYLACFLTLWGILRTLGIIG